MHMRQMCTLHKAVNDISGRRGVHTVESEKLFRG